MTQEKNIDLETGIMLALVESDHHIKIPTREEGFILATRNTAIYPRLNDLLGYEPEEEKIMEAAQNLYKKRYIHITRISDITFLALTNLGKKKYSC